MPIAEGAEDRREGELHFSAILGSSAPSAIGSSPEPDESLG